MGITPIAGLIPLSVARAIQPDLAPLPMERVENSPRTADETYSPSNGKSGRGSEDDAADEESTDDGGLELEDEMTPSEASPRHSAPGAISFFA